jgi:hypothetical protein
LERLQLECAPPQGTGMGFEPAQFHGFGPIDVGEDVRSGIAQEFFLLAPQGKFWDGVGGPAAEIAVEREGLRGRGFRQSRGSRSWALGPWNRG